MKPIKLGHNSNMINFKNRFISQNKEGESRNLSYINALKTGDILNRYEFACKFCEIKYKCKIFLSDRGSKRSYNFYGGMLPFCVAKKIKKEIFNSELPLNFLAYKLKKYDNVIFEAKELLNQILGLKNKFEIIFLQSSASSQFYMVPLNFLSNKMVSNYIITDNWSENALSFAKKIGKIHVAASSKSSNNNYIPKEWNISKFPAYVHITSNNTIFGTKWKKIPDFGNIPLIADMTSDILSRPINFSKLAMIYAGSQKNLGVPGITLVVIRKDMIKMSKNSNCPEFLKYSNILQDNSDFYKKPPSMAIYIIKLILEWIKEEGGLAEINKINKKKASIVYNTIDQSKGFYIGHAKKETRSLMNITFNLKNEKLTKIFINEAAKRGLNGLKGLQSENGLRASIFNAMPEKACQKLADFMKYFQKKYTN